MGIQQVCGGLKLTIYRPFTLFGYDADEKEM